MRLQTNNKSILVIPDLQIPFHHRDALAFLRDIRDEYNPDEVVCVGDEVDQYGLSRYTHDPDVDSAGAEYRASAKYLARLYTLFPDVKVCLSNHTDRVIKRALEAGIPKGYMKSIKEFMNAPPGWHWNRTWTINGIRFEHGDAAGGIQAHRNLAIANRCSTVIGHHHSTAGIEYIANEDSLIFGMNVGCLIDIEAYAFAYAKTAKHKPILSCGAVLGGAPALIPMLTKKSGRYLYA